MKTYEKRISGCRICGHTKLTAEFFLGNRFISDFVPYNEIYNGVRSPIDIVSCPNCSLVQNQYDPPIDTLYQKHYWYRSGTTETMRKALTDVAVAACLEVNLDPGDVVLDIGANDGTLLNCFKDFPFYKVGVEPAENFRVPNPAFNIDCWITGLWDAQTYHKNVPQKAKIITACGMFYDLVDPTQFILDVASALHEKGVFLAQLMCLQNMVETCDLGNLCHEHLEFYTLKSLQVLLDKAGLEIYRVEVNQVNGQSYLLFIQHKKTGIHEVQPNVENQFSIEEDLLLRTRRMWSMCQVNKPRTVDFIRKETYVGKLIHVYGASTKGNTILQYLGLGYWNLPAAAEVSPEKIGKFTIGTGIPIISQEDSRSQNPDYYLVLPYAFIEEFVKREADQEWRKRGGKFIVPFPSLRIV